MTSRKAPPRRKSVRSRAAQARNKAFVHYSVQHAVEHFRALHRG